MTLETFITEIAKFGGGYVIEDRETLISSANRALMELYLNIPITKTVKFNLRGHKPTIYYKEIVCKTGESILLPFEGRAYSMRILGKGSCTIVDGTTTVRQFDTGNKPLLVRGLISNGGTIKFWSGFNFVIYDFSIYDELYSPNIESIPDGAPITVFDVRATYGDFLAFTSPPTDRYGNIIENCRLRDGVLEIDSSFSGEIILTYRRKPIMIDGTDKEYDSAEVIDLNEEYSHLLMYLTWYHYWYNSDDTKAKLYKAKFDDMVALIKENYRSIDRSYINVNGWA